MKENKGKVIALCGKVACGKTYYSSKLKEKENAIIFSVDELTFYMFDNRKGENYTDLTNRAINYFKEKSIEIVDKGVNVILDIGLWSKKERKELSEFFKSKNVNLEIHYIDIDDKSWEENIIERNKRIDEGKRGFDFYISDGLRKKIKENWEEPDEKEIDVWYNFKRDK